MIILQYIKLHFIGSLFSSISFPVFFYLYVVIVGGEIEYLSIPIMIVFAFPIYFLIANPITILVRIFLKKYFRDHTILLTFIVMLVAFLFNYGIAVNINSGLSLPTSDILADGYIEFIIFSFLTALPSVLGVQYSNNRR